MSSIFSELCQSRTPYLVGFQASDLEAKKDQYLGSIPGRAFVSTTLNGG